MKQYYCTYESIYRLGCYDPSPGTLLSVQPRPCQLYADPKNYRIVLQLEDNAKPVNMVLAGLIWKEDKENNP